MMSMIFREIHEKWGIFSGNITIFGGNTLSKQIEVSKFMGVFATHGWSWFW